MLRTPASRTKKALSGLDQVFENPPQDFQLFVHCFSFTPPPPSWCRGQQSACQRRRRGFDPWVGKIPGSRKWKPTPVFLPGTFHGQRSLVDYSPWGLKESDTTEHVCHAKSHSLLGRLLIKLTFSSNANI